MRITRTVFAATLGILSLVKHTVATVYVNELVADNENGIVDENDQNEDWVELYNSDSVEFDLSGFYLTDDEMDPNQWEIPANTTIDPDGFLLFWCDDDEDEGPLHTNFKLSKDGEGVYLYDSTLSLVSSLVFGELGDDESYGLYPDGNDSENGVVMSTPTPYGPNMYDPTLTLVITNTATEVSIGVTGVDAGTSLTLYWSGDNGGFVVPDNSPQCPGAEFEISLSLQNSLDFNSDDPIVVSTSMLPPGITYLQVVDPADCTISNTETISA